MTMKQLSVPKPQISSRRDVDDELKSVASVEEAVELANDIQEMCKRGGFNLHKFTSIRKEVDWN